MSVDPNDIPAMAQAVQEALVNGEPFGPAIAEFVQLDALPSRLRPVEKFLMDVDVTIYIGKHGPCYKRLPDDRVEMPVPGTMPLNLWYSAALHELIHFTEWRTCWRYKGAALDELRCELGEVILETLLRHPFDDQAHYRTWHDRWLAQLEADPTCILDVTEGAINGVQLLIDRASNPIPWTPQRRYINECFGRLLDHVRQKQSEITA